MTKGLTTQQQVRRLFNENRPEQEATINEHFSNDTVGVPRLGPAGLANSSERVAPQMGCQLSLDMAEDDLYVDNRTRCSTK